MMGWRELGVGEFSRGGNDGSYHSTQETGSCSFTCVVCGSPSNSVKFY